MFNRVKSPGNATINSDKEVELIRSSNRLYQLAVETQSGKVQEFGGNSYQMTSRGGKGHKPGERTKFAKVLPPPIELVNWEEMEGKPASNGKAKSSALFE